MTEEAKLKEWARLIIEGGNDETLKESEPVLYEFCQMMLTEAAVS